MNNRTLPRVSKYTITIHPYDYNNNSILVDKRCSRFEVSLLGVLLIPRCKSQAALYHSDYMQDKKMAQCRMKRNYSRKLLESSFSIFTACSAKPRAFMMQFYFYKYGHMKSTSFNRS